MIKLSTREREIITQLIKVEIEYDITFQKESGEKDFDYTKELINIWKKVNTFSETNQETILNEWEGDME